MKIWKKAISAGLTAMLLASLTASAAFALVGGDGESDQSTVIDCDAAAVASAASCSQVADGISTVTLGGDTNVGAGSSVYIVSSGATIISAADEFTLAGGIITAVDGADINDATDQFVLRAPATPGTATVSVYTIATATGIATLEGTLAITFTATSGLDLSASNSSVTIVPSTDACNDAELDSNVAPMGTNPAAKLCVNLEDGNGNAIEAGYTVAATITPVGLVAADLSDGTDASAATAQAASQATDTLAGSYAFAIGGSGLPGTATIGISVTKDSSGATTTFAPKTFIFSGAVASVTASNELNTVDYTSGATVAVNYTGKDAAGNPVAFTADSATSSDATVLTIGAIVAYAGDPDVPGTVAVDCQKQGTATVTVKEGAISSNAVTVICSGDAVTFSVAFSAATVTPGGSATITVTLLDSKGLLASDAATPAGIYSSGAATAFTDPENVGTSTATYLAPFNTGVATALVTVTDISGSQSAQINVGAVVPAVTSGTNASALGITTSGTFDTTTKVAALGKYQTFKLSFGAGAAGQTVGMLVATKNSAGVWSGFTRVTGRVADASGNVYYYVRNSSATWISLRGDLGGTLTNAVQGRWR